MKRALVIVMGIILVVSGLTFSYAQESSGTKDVTTDKEAMMMCKQRMKGHGCDMKSMMSPSLLETKDGGIVVMMGNKLMKYDKDLNLVKEAEVKIDVEEMQKMMKCYPCPLCPLHKKTMEEGSGTKGEGSGMK